MTYNIELEASTMTAVVIELEAYNYDVAMFYYDAEMGYDPSDFDPADGQAFDPDQGHDVIEVDFNEWMY